MPSETYEHEVDVQYRDLDPRSHVNHAHFVSYLEEGKAALFRDELGLSLSEAGTAVKTLEIEYLASIEADETVTVSLGPITLGTTSYTTQYELTVDGTAVARAETVSVLLDDDGRPTELPTAWRERFEPYEP